MLLWLFSLIVLASSAFLATTSSDSNTKACYNGGEVIKLTPSGYVLPLTSYPDFAVCKYIFELPPNYFAYVQLNAIDLGSYETVEIRDKTGTGSDIDYSTFTSSQAWPLDFYVDIQTLDQSFARLSLNITLFPARPKANIVKSYVTFPGSASVFLYANEWNEGESYKFTSKNGKLYILVASQTNATDYDDSVWNNVFIYDGGVLQGTLARTALDTQKQVPYQSTSGEVILYCAKKVNVVGAVMITDLSNVDGVEHYMEYVPDVPGQFPFVLSAEHEQSAITLVTSRQNPEKVTIEMVNNFDINGVFSYISGGPLQNHSNAKNLTNDVLPKTIKSYAETYYLSKGAGVIGFDIKP